ncbi:16S rRNA (guanine(1405)-N(7))-methyltransferase [Anaerobacterium chartisolvens]|uniref:16S rRNA (guanine(1405)-N(7))-methyltransferase n=1 Tax=Anaerobacterium chartisolvens TaxID=1297424 RepID=A0A369AQ27_9FIRM|nr:16S rRNA (guanine(1405)-N(7))-methyltransferase [Anaerobacterium chartisolvens]
MCVNAIVEKVSQSKKYGNICNDTIIRICEDEFKKFKLYKDIEKSVKSKLHKIQGAYIGNKEYNEIALYVDELTGKGFLEETELKKICQRILELHRSTAERLYFYDRFYQEIFKVTGFPESVMDIACGFNPFSVQWMQAGKKIRYYAYDINFNQIALLNSFFKAIEYPADAFVQDVICKKPEECADIAFIFKFIPIIEFQRKKYSLELIRSLKAKHVVLSFPKKGISGRRNILPDEDIEYMYGLILNELNVIKKIEFSNEMLYVINNH